MNFPVKPAYWLAGVMLALFSGAAGAATRYVGDCGTPNTTTIAAALAAASAGDTINICPGTYNESVTVNSTGLTIKGSTGNAADVKVTGTYPFTVMAASITLKDMTLNTAGAGVFTSNGSAGPHVFENLVVSAGSYGFYLWGPSSAATFKNVAATSSTQMAIYIAWNAASGGHVFEDVTAIGGSWGIYVDGGVERLTNVNAEGKSRGAITMGNKYATTFSNVTAISSGGYDHGIFINAAYATNHPYTFTKVTASGNNRGINIDRSGKVTMTDVTATATGEYAIYLNWNADGAHVFDNVTATGSTGLSLQRGAASLKNVTATGTSGSAIWMGNKYAATFDTVTASAPNHRGIEIANSDAVNNLYTFTNVKVTSKSRGINIARSGKVTMNGVTMTTSDIGIWFEGDADGAHELSNLDITSSQTAIYAAQGLAKIEDFKIGNGISVGTKYDATIRRGVISGPGLGIYIAGAQKKKVTIQDVTISTNWDYGIMLMKASEALIQRVCVSGMSSTGIFMDGNADNVTLRDSQFGNSGTYGGVMVFSNPDNKATVTNNAFLKTSLWRAWSNSKKHKFDGNYWQGVPGGTTYMDGNNNIRDKETLDSNPVASCYSGASASATLSAHYKFDDVSGWSSSDSLDDSSGNNKNATLSGTVTQEAAPASGIKPDTCKAGNFNKAGWFATASGLDIDTAKNAKNSVSFWMYWDGGFSSSNFTMPFSWGGVYYDLAVSKYRSEMGNGAIGFNTGNGDIYGATADGLANGWHHVAAVFNNGDTDKNKLYIDGVQKTLKSYGSQSERYAATSAGIGAGAGWGGDYKWSGKLDNLKIYRGTISSAQIAADMAETVSCGVGSVKPANFNCVESGASASNGHLYTRLAGAAFSFDVVALKADGSTETAYASDTSKNVTVELVDGSGSTACASRAAVSPAVSQTLTFAAANAGRKAAASVTVAKAYPDLRCRVTDASQSPSIVGCSTDNFAVRPTGFTVTSSANADAAGVSASAAPAVKTGANFTLTAASGAAGYNAAPRLDASKVAAHGGAVQAGALAGSFANADPATGTATGAAFAYSEAGYFNLAANGVYDDTFTAVDSAAGDCASGFADGGGKYACNFGNAAATPYFGRFIPDHFALVQGAATPACGGFTYFGQDGFGTSFTLMAQNSANVVTRNYTGNFARLGLAAWSNFVFTSDSLPAGSVFQASAIAPTGNWSNGVAAVTAKHQASRPTALAGETSVAVKAAPVDPDGVTMAAAQVAAGTPLRYGRLRLSNAYGSELLSLALPVEAQYWNGSQFVTNGGDSCTELANANFGFGNYLRNLASAEMGGSHAPASVTLVNGKGSLPLTRPSGGDGKYAGSVDVCVNLDASATNACAATSAAMPWLLGNWGGAAFTYNPAARATFGAYKTPVIYMREMY